MERALVAVAAPVRGLFTYSVPAELADGLQPGQLVEVPFGAGRRRGVVLEGDPPLEATERELKPITSLVEDGPLVSEGLLRTLRWAGEYYLVPPGEMVFAALPPALRKLGGRLDGRQVQVAEMEAVAVRDEEVWAALRARAPRQAELLSRLREQGPTDVAVLERELRGARPALAALARKGLVRIGTQRRERVPLAADLPASAPVTELTEAQAGALARIEAALEARGSASFLLHGVTGSGKTEVYLRAIARTLALQRGAILLVPEIALTPQLVARVTERFGELVAVLHSGLSEGERLDEWVRLREGRARVAVGARSAMFAPLASVGLIVVDEEHDSSYKQSERLPYSGRDLALVRAREEGAVVVLGSATPSLESYANARSGRHRLLELPERVQRRPLPEVEVVDLRQELDPQERAHTIGRRLAEALAQTLDRGEQAILFLNRRGYSSFALCKDCGKSVHCRNCSVALVHHLKEGLLRCHYCGLAERVPQVCPTCGRGRLQLFGLGTEKCEEEIRRRFPGARVVRLDSDSAAGRGRMQQMMGRFARGEADVLIGTQMVTKGHDVPGVTLVGVVLADLGLNLPDFRAGERTFQLLMQVAGRAGRGERPGRVVIQTFLPGHPSIVLARDHGFSEFFEQESQRRQGLGYPPAKRLLMVRVSHPAPEIAQSVAKELAAVFRREAGSRSTLLGPVASPLARLHGRFRWQMLLKCARVEDLQRLAHAVLRRAPVVGGVKILFDVDPVDML